MNFNLDSIADLLVCPKSKSPLVQEEASLVSVDPECRLKYEVRDGIPIMLIEEAVQLSSEQWSEIMRRNGRDPVSGDAPNADRSQEETK